MSELLRSIFHRKIERYLFNIDKAISDENIDVLRSLVPELKNLPFDLYKPRIYRLLHTENPRIIDLVLEILTHGEVLEIYTSVENEIVREKFYDYLKDSLLSNATITIDDLSDMLKNTENIVGDTPRERTQKLIVDCLAVKAARADDGSAVKKKFRSKKSKTKKSKSKK